MLYSHKDTDAIILEITRKLRNGDFSFRKVRHQLETIGVKHLRYSHLRSMRYASWKGKMRNANLGRDYDAVRALISNWEVLIDQLHYVSRPVRLAINKCTRRIFPNSTRLQRKQLAEEVFAAMKKALDKRALTR